MTQLLVKPNKNNLFVRMFVLSMANFRSPYPRISVFLGASVQPAPSSFALTVLVLVKGAFLHHLEESASAISCRLVACYHGSAHKPVWSLPVVVPNTQLGRIDPHHLCEVACAPVHVITVEPVPGVTYFIVPK